MVWCENTCRKHMLEDMSEHMSDFTSGSKCQNTSAPAFLVDEVSLSVHVPRLFPVVSEGGDRLK